MHKVLIVDDNAALALQLEEFLPTIGYQVLGIATSGREAVRLAKDLRPDLILMDIKLPGKINGIQSAAMIKSELGIEIIFISGYADVQLLEQAKLVEPLSYLHKPFSDEQITAALKMAFFRIHQKNTWIAPSEWAPGNYEGFSTSEIRIAELIKRGRSTKEIAAVLGLSEATVVWHRKSIRKKLGISKKNRSIQEVILHNDSNE